MPQFKQLTADEVAKVTARHNNLDELGPYIDFLKTLDPGAWFLVELTEGDHKRTVKRRVSIAGTSLGQRVKWRRPTDGGLLGVFGDARN